MAYAGIPLITSDGETVGTLCAIDIGPRDWTDDQLARLALLADVAMDQLSCSTTTAPLPSARRGKAYPSPPGGERLDAAQA